MSRKQRTVISIVAMLLLSAVEIRAQDSSKRAEDLLSKARQALGGDAKLKAVQSLSLSATFDRVLGEMRADGEIELDLMLPDKFKKLETMNLPMGKASVTRLEGFNGDEHFADSKTNSGGAGGVMIFRGPADGPDADKKRLLNALRNEFARDLVMLLLSTSETMPLEFSYGGEAQSDDGMADVIDIRGSEGFAAKLFLDKQEHRPLMMSYRAAAPQVKLMTKSIDGKDPEAKKRIEELKKNPEAGLGKPEIKEVDVQIFLSEYQEVNGVMLPHKISRSVDGKPAEEWTIKKYKVNPPLRAEQFKK